MNRKPTAVVFSHTPRRKILWPRIIGLVVFALLALALVRHQALADWLKLRSYQAPAAISVLADETTMTPAARHLFYLNHATLDNKSGFQKHCPSFSEQTIVLGCYQSGQRGIAILKVEDSRLAGVEQVTAAHETLHAAYERLSGGERSKVNAMLQDYFAHHLSDQRIKDTLKSYETSEPGQQLNEMHSIFGTEIAQLPAPLARYYQKYFTDRSRVVAYANQYTSAFTSRKKQVAQYDAQLKAWKVQIDEQSNDLRTRDDSLTAQGDMLERYKTSGNYRAYNAGVPAYNAAIDSYNAEIATLKDLISQYNALVSKRNAIALEEQQLQAALDSTVPETK